MTIGEQINDALLKAGAIGTHGDSGHGYAAAATFSPDRKYRYSLTRTWGDGSPVIFVMLNPSTADAYVVDPTVRRCIGYAKDWGADGLVVLNIFAWRSTDPKALYDAAPDFDPVGPLNDVGIDAIPGRNGRLGFPVVAAWGAHGGLNNRGPEVAARLINNGVDLGALGTTKNGHPKHPLYLSKELQTAAYTGEVV